MNSQDVLLVITNNENFRVLNARVDARILNTDLVTGVSTEVHRFSLRHHGMGVYSAQIPDLQRNYNRISFNVISPGHQPVLMTFPYRTDQAFVYDLEMALNPLGGFLQRRPLPSPTFPRMPNPVLFVHGLNSSAQIWNPLIEHMEKMGFQRGGQIDVNLGGVYHIDNVALSSVRAEVAGDLWTINFQSEHQSSNKAGVYLQSKAIQLAVDRIKRVTGSSRVILVGHSMGGLAIAGYIVGDPYGTGRASLYQNDVSRAVTIGSPFGGAALANILELLGTRMFDFEYFLSEVVRTQTELTKASFLPLPLAIQRIPSILQRGEREIVVPMDAIRDLVIPTDKHNNIFLFGGHETEISDFNPDVNYNREIDKNRIEGIRHRPWPDDVDVHFIIGHEKDLMYLKTNSDGIVKAEHQYFPVRASTTKSLVAHHVSPIGPLICSQPKAFDALVEGIFGSHYKGSFSIRPDTEYLGVFGTHDEIVTRSLHKYDIKLAHPSELTIHFRNAPVPVEISILDPAQGTILEEYFVDAFRSTTITRELDDLGSFPARVELRVVGQNVETSRDGFGGILKTACSSDLEQLRNPYTLRYSVQERRRVEQRSHTLAVCDTWSVANSGGVEGTIDIWDISVLPENVMLDVRYDMYQIPDQLLMEYPSGNLRLDTGWRGDSRYARHPNYPGGVTSPGQGEVLDVFRKDGIDQFIVRVNARDNRTLWRYKVRCREPRQETVFPVSGH